MQTNQDINKNDNLESVMGFHSFKRNSAVESFPEDFTKYVKSFGKIFFWPQGNFHVVTDAQLAKKLLSDKAVSCDRSPFFISRMPNMDLSLIQDFLSVVSKMMVMSDDEDHRVKRKVASFGIKDTLIDYYSKAIPGIVDELIEQRSKEGKIDFFKDIANQIPAIVLADLFNIPTEDRSKFYQWSNTMTAFFGGGTSYENKDGIEVNEAARALKSYFKDLIRERRLNPKLDFVSGMLEVAERFNMNEEDLISQAIMMLVAGQVTTTDQMCNIMYLLLKDRDLLKSVQQNNELLPIVIEELKRLDPAVTFIFRVTRDKIELDDYTIEAGETLFISTHCINRDENLFPNPDEVDLTRKTPNHFSYGHGAHFCLGARLGRIEMQKVFEHILLNYPDLKIGGGRSIRDHYSLSFSGFKSLPIQLFEMH